MSHRRRGALFALASIAAGLIAASAVARHERSVAGEPAALRAVVVARVALAAGDRVAPGSVALRRFPASFVPAGVLADEEQVVGERLATAVPAGAYLLATMIGPPARAAHAERPVARRGTPIELAVAGARALRRAGLPHRRVDVLITRDSNSGLGGRTAVAVAGARLVALESGGTAARESIATLIVGRSDALKLIEAESYAREIRLVSARR